MFKLLLFLIGSISCDLLHFNRLGNNVYARRKYRNDMVRRDYGQQIVQWIIDNGGELELPDRAKFQAAKVPKPKMPSPAFLQNRRSRRNRLKQYRRSMLRN